MVVPLHPAHENGETVPLVIRSCHVYLWHLVTLLFFLLMVAQALAIDILGAINAGLMIYFIRFMVSDGCQKMSQQCLLMLGFMCVLSTLLQSLQLMELGNAGGRMIQTRSQESQNTFVLRVERHPFFEKNQGFLYNLQSGLLIASPIVNAVAAIMCYVSYNAYSSSFFADDNEDYLLGGNAGQQYGTSRYPEGGGAPEHYNGQGRQLSYSDLAQQRTSTSSRLFEGQGHRLGT